MGGGVSGSQDAGPRVLSADLLGAPAGKGARAPGGRAGRAGTDGGSPAPRDRAGAGIPGGRAGAAQLGPHAALHVRRGAGSDATALGAAGPGKGGAAEAGEEQEEEGGGGAPAGGSGSGPGRGLRRGGPAQLRGLSAQGSVLGWLPAA